MATNPEEKTTDMTTAKAAPPAAPPAVPPASQNASERFTAMVMKQFGGTVGAPELTDFQKRLIQGYFIAVDRALKTAEEERIRKNSSNSNHKYDNDLPVTWENVNLVDLALDAVHYARMGLDMMQENFLFPIPYKNNKKNCYDVNLMKGYNGIRYIAEKYALEKPVAVTVELVYSTDTFVPIKKGLDNRVEGYQFKINQPFDRGEIKGGFGYIQYADPTRNELIIMPLKAIEKRKPEYASANFWGGKTTTWETGEDGKRHKVEKEVDGWYDEMCLKTLIREVYSAKHIQRDPQKIDESYQYMKLREAQIAQMQAQEEVDIYANGEIIDTSPTLPPAAPAVLPSAPATLPVNPDTGEVIEAAETNSAPAAPTAAPTAAPEVDQQMTMGGPDF